jgi:lysophospholipase L1-like esterase
MGFVGAWTRRKAVRKWIVLGGLAVLGAGGLAAWLALRGYASAATADPAFFEESIVAFEEADRAQAPAPGGIVFVGSSSIRFWSSLEADMAPLRVLNRGFGGAQFSHLLHNVHRVVTPYAPRAVVTYAGDNDLAEGTGKNAQRVFGDYQRFVAQVRERLPGARFYFLAIKPSIRRWARWPEMRRANARIEAWSAADPLLSYLDVATPLLGEGGEPRDDVFLADGLHLNAEGYAAWTRVVQPRLAADLAAGG